jgi:hypothetical protein
VAGGLSVQVLDVSNPQAVKILEGLGCGGHSPQSVAVTGNYACMVDRGENTNGVSHGRLYVFERQTLGVESNFAVQGSGSKNVSCTFPPEAKHH